MGAPHPTPIRHAELVSASTAPQWRSSRAAKWTLKQVQGDEAVLFSTGRQGHFHRRCGAGDGDMIVKCLSLFVFFIVAIGLALVLSIPLRSIPALTSRELFGMRLDLLLSMWIAIPDRKSVV